MLHPAWHPSNHEACRTTCSTAEVRFLRIAQPSVLFVQQHVPVGLAGPQHPFAIVRDCDLRAVTAASSVHRLFLLQVRCQPIVEPAFPGVHSNPEPDLSGHARLRRTAMRSDREILPSTLQTVVLLSCLQKWLRQDCLRPSLGTPVAHFREPVPSAVAFEPIQVSGDPLPAPFVRSVRPRRGAFHVARHAGV